MQPNIIRHGLAMCIAAILVFAVGIQNKDFLPRADTLDSRLMREYTPYFPGLADLDQHEIFSPKYAHTKKIVLLGASTVDSIGCDYTWHKPPPDGQRNVHYTCSVTGQLNDLLQRAGLTGWRAFNLARNGMKLTPELYVYTRLLALKPDVVILGEGFNFYMWENAGAEDLKPAQYAYLDKVFDAMPETAATWRAYRENLVKHGWKPPPAVAPETAAATHQDETVSISDILLNSLTRLRSEQIVDQRPGPIRFNPDYWQQEGKTLIEHLPVSELPHEFKNPDPGFDYFQGYTLISALQKAQGGEVFFYFSPQLLYSRDQPYKDGLKTIYGSYLNSHGIPFASYLSLDMKPTYDTYDGSHNTIYGNRKIATAILKDLQADHLLN